ncbi:MAG: SPW repeat protein [Myxococcales bacterium]|nr:SPW repeat protein [Myxococcales bacterium]MCB9701353.1 SPW repeat protein [Myxococcales bacterium]
MEHRIRTNPIFAIFLVAASAFILGVSALTGPSVNTITGVVLLVLGILQLSRPLIVVTEGEIQFRNLLGMTLRRVPYTLDNLDVSDELPKIDGQPVKGFSTWALDGKALAGFREEILSRQASRDPQP